MSVLRKQYGAGLAMFVSYPRQDQALFIFILCYFKRQIWGLVMQYVGFQILIISVHH